MSQELKVAIIDDDRLSSHNWNILLKFIGETPLMLTGENWQRELNKSENENTIFMLMVGSLMETRFNENAVTELISLVHQWDDKLPILLKTAQVKLDNLDVSSKALLLELPEQSDYQSLLSSLEKAREGQGLKAPELESNLISETGTAMFRSLVGKSDLMQESRELMHQVADKMVNVLVLGESGTGKEIMARNLHYHSGRGKDPFIAVNCALVSNELFGHEAGFNGATETQHGLFEKAHKGTLFFDEISDMSLEMQAKVMQFLERQSFERLGGSETIQTDVRVVAASNQNLEEKITQGLFRDDLYYRLSVIPIDVPALRKHAEDIPDLINEIVARLEGQSKDSVRFNSSAMLSLQRHGWPGNVRELANLVERLSIIQPNAVIGVSDLPIAYQYVGEDELAQLENPEVISNEEESEQDSAIEVEEVLIKPQALQALTANSLEDYLNNFEKHFIQVALDDSAGLLNFAAERLAMDDKSLQDKMKQHGL